MGFITVVMLSAVLSSAACGMGVGGGGALLLRMPCTNESKATYGRILGNAVWQS